MRDAVVEPFREFFGRHGLQSALLVLAFLFFYKLGDSLCTALATPFYLDMGYSKTEIGIIAKNAGLWPSVIGGIVGGIWMVKLGINRALWLFGLVQLVTILGFVWMAWIGPAQLALLGIETAIQTSDLGDKGVFHRVRVGPFRAMDEVNRTRSLLTQNNIPATLVKEVPTPQETP